MVVGQVAPLAPGQVVVIGLPGGVGVVDPADGLLPGLAEGVHGVLDLILLFGVDEDVHHVGKVPQDIIGPTAHDNAGTFLGDLADGLGLGHDGLVISRGRRAGHEPVEDAPGAGGLLGVVDHLLAEAGLLGGQPDDVLVVVRDAQDLGNSLGNGAAAGAVLTADGDDTVKFAQNDSSSYGPLLPFGLV